MSLPKEFFTPLIEKAIDFIKPDKIILFGSFARGDAREKSDIDLAFQFQQNDEKWILFKSWVQDEFRTLRQLDLVNLYEADDSIVESVKREGVILYERKN